MFEPSTGIGSDILSFRKFTTQDFTVELVEDICAGEEDGYYSHCCERFALPTLAIASRLLSDPDKLDRTYQLLRAIHQAIPKGDWQRMFDFQIFVKNGRVLGPWKEKLVFPPIELTQPEALICIMKAGSDPDNIIRPRRGFITRERAEIVRPNGNNLNFRLIG